MILLSFDIEEFDAPLEHGVELPFEEQMRTSVEGTRKILACLARHRVKATFFCTANFALHAKDLILDIQKGGHEIASHGFYHSFRQTGRGVQTKCTIPQDGSHSSSSGCGKTTAEGSNAAYMD